MSPRKKPNTRPRRVKVKTLFFETDFYTRRPTRILIKRAGLVATAIYQIAVCHAGIEEENYIITEASISAIAEDMDLDPNEIRKVLDICCSPEVDYLERVPEGYCSERLLREAGVLEEKQSNYIEAAKQREELKRANRNGSQPTQTKIEQDEARLSKIESNLGQRTKIEQDSLEQELEQEQEEDLDLDQEKEKEPPPPDPDESKYVKLARGMFAPDAVESPIGTGRRPLQKYPLIRTTVHELAALMEDYDRDGVPKEYRKDAFQAVEARFRLYHEQGKTTDNINPILWLNGFAKRDVLETIRKARDLKRSELYLERAAS